MAPPAPAVIISAYAVYPLPHSAEGIVNAALVDELRTRRRGALLTSAAGYQPVRAVDPAADCGVTTYAAGGPPVGGSVARLARWPTHPKRHPLGATARLVDRARVYRRLAPLAEAAWSRRAAATILRLLAGKGRTAVVWARGTPPQSLAAAVRAFQARPFPLVVYTTAQPVLHLKAPVGGFRYTFPHPWRTDPVPPRPSPTVLYTQQKHGTPAMQAGYQLFYVLKQLAAIRLSQGLLEPLRIRQRWRSARRWAAWLAAQEEPR